MKLTKLLALVAVGAGLFAAARAATVSSDTQPKATSLEAAPAESYEAPATLPSALTRDNAPKLGTVNLATVEETRSEAMRVRRGAAPSIDDLVGSRTVYAHVNSSGRVYANTATVTKVSDDTVQISDFILTGLNVKAAVDAAGNVTIPVQEVYYISDGENHISICPMDFDNSVYSVTQPVLGSIDGTDLYVDGGFGFFVTKGASVGAYLNVGLMSYAIAGVSNASITEEIITFNNSSATTDNRVVTPQTTTGYIRQINSSTLRLTGVPVSSYLVDMDMTVTPAGAIEIDPQRVYIGSYYFYNYTMTETVSGTSISIGATILSPMSATLSQADGKATIGIGKWMVGNTSVGYLSLFNSTTVTADIEVSVPAAPVFSLSGEGTAESPYLISSAADWKNFADVMNTDASIRTAATDSVDGSTATQRVWAGKYFKVTADIDLGTLDETVSPAGNKTVRFAGTLDGDGHTIKGFRLDGYPYDYAAPIAFLDCGGVVKNLIFDSPRITTAGYTAAHVVGTSYGIISNCHVTNGYLVGSEGYNYGGIAAYNYGVIADCSAGGYIYGMGYLGGIAARSFRTVVNCSATTRIYMTYKQVFAGGIVGYLYDLTDSGTTKVEGCWFNGSITAANQEIGIGGIVGGCYYATVSECFAIANLANLSATSASVGGVVGTVACATVKDCYSAGHVYNYLSTQVGGVVGHTAEYQASQRISTITNCYASGLLDTGSEYSRRGVFGDGTFKPTMTNCYYDAQIAAVDNDTIGLTTAAMTTAEGLTGFSTDVWQFTEGLYPTLKRFAGVDASAASAAPLFIKEGYNVKLVKDPMTYSTANDVVWSAYVNGTNSTEGGKTFTFNNGTCDLNYSQATDTIFVSKGSRSRYFIVNIAPLPWEGEGTADSPWLIQNRQDMTDLCNISNDANLTFEGKYFKVTADIDMQGDTIRPVCHIASTSPSTGFCGTFDGDGHVIDNFKVITVGYTDAGVVNAKDANSTYNGGLFGVVYTGGTVKNVTVGPKAVIYGFSYTGTVAGTNLGTVDNCRNHATVYAYAMYGGGIVGNAGSGSVTSNCYNDGTVNGGYINCGGIAGYAVSATITGCQNSGDVTVRYLNDYQAAGKQYTAGGIVGVNSKSTIVNCVNTGSIDSYKNVGGIVGQSTGTASVKTLIGCVNYGTVSSDDATLGSQLLATNTNNGLVDSCYTDYQRSTLGAVVTVNPSGVTAANTSVLVAGNLPLPAVFSQAAGRYPMLAAFVDEPVAQLAAKAVVIFDDGNSAINVSRPATLAAVDDMAWSLRSGANFSIVGSTLNVVVPDEGSANDTIVATMGAMTRALAISTFNGNIFSGSGTAEDPYLITCTDDMLKLANFVNTTGYGYPGQHFRVTANLDFTDIAYVPVGIDVKFEATFDGADHTIDGIAYATESTDKTAIGRGLFGTVGPQGVIKNVTVGDKSSFSAYQNVGAIAGINYGRIDSCINNATVSTVGTTGAGGIVGYGYGASAINLCVNNGTVTSKTTYAGGIIAISPAGAEIAITNCANFGAITGTAYAGGVAGYASALLDSCGNAGEVKTTATTGYAGGLLAYGLLPSSAANCENRAAVTGAANVGGIVAHAVAHTGPQFTVTDCHNYGAITTTGTAASYCGGVVGSALGGAVISKCHNEGVITSSRANCAGIVARLTCTAYGGDVIDCYNTGAVNGYQGCGGIVGIVSNPTYSKVERCYNTADITASYASYGYAGGIVGNGSCNVYDSWNSGNITAAGPYVGGIWGYTSSAGAKGYRLANFGDITSTVQKDAFVGGITGVARINDLYDCYNFGTITGYNTVGGIAGAPYNASANSYYYVIHRSYNAGKLVVTGDGCDNVGNIVAYYSGYKLTNTQVVDCYYDSDVSEPYAYDATVGGITGVKVSQMSELASVLGDSFDYAPNCYPSLKSLADVDENLIRIPAVVLYEGDTYETVSKDFHVGVFPGVTWTASDNLLVDSEGTVYLQNEEANQDAWITLTTKGGKTKTIKLFLTGKTGVEAPVADGDIDHVEYYDLNGRRIAEPARGTVVIVRTVYVNGAVTTKKVVAE